MSRSMMPRAGVVTPYVVVSRDQTIAGVASVDTQKGVVDLTTKYLQIATAQSDYVSKTFLNTTLAGYSTKAIADTLYLAKNNPILPKGSTLKAMGDNGTADIDLIHVRTGDANPSNNNKVIIGEADKGINGVEIHSQGRVSIFAVPQGSNTTAEYPLYSTRYRPLPKDLAAPTIGTYLTDANGWITGVNPVGFGINSDIKELNGLTKAPVVNGKPVFVQDQTNTFNTNGAITFTSATDATRKLAIGVGSTDMYISNQKANKFLQLRDDGTLSYDSKPILNSETGMKALLIPSLNNVPADGWVNANRGIVTQIYFTPQPTNLNTTDAPAGNACWGIGINAKTRDFHIFGGPTESATPNYADPLQGPVGSRLINLDSNTRIGGRLNLTPGMGGDANLPAINMFIPTGASADKRYMRGFRNYSGGTMYHEVIDGTGYRIEAGSATAANSNTADPVIKMNTSMVEVGSQELHIRGGKDNSAYYGFIIRNDGNNTYFMLTNKAQQGGSYNALRPLTISNSAGSVSMGQGLTVAGGLNVSTGTLQTHATPVFNADGNACIINASSTTKGCYYRIRRGGADHAYMGFGSDNNNGFTIGVNVLGTSLSFGADKRLTYSGGTVAFTGTITASDERLKEDIKPIENSLAKLSSLKGVSFTWNEKADVGGSVKGHGVIAQDVEKVLPEAIHDAPQEGYKGVDYNAIIGLLVNSVNELKAEVDSLKQEVATLKGGRP